jgi:hypothetical protein
MIYEDKLMKVITLLMTVATVTAVSGALNFGLAMEGQQPKPAPQASGFRDGYPIAVTSGPITWVLYNYQDGRSISYYRGSTLQGMPRKGDDADSHAHFTIDRGQKLGTIGFHGTLGDGHLRFEYNVKSGNLNILPLKKGDKGVPTEKLGELRSEAMNFIKAYVSAKRAGAKSNTNTKN